MRFTAVTQDRLLIVDGVIAVTDFTMNGEWAVQFNGYTAEIEYTDFRPNELIDDVEFYLRYQYLLDIHAAYIAAQPEPIV